MSGPTLAEFFKFSNPLFLDVFVAIVLYALSRLLAWRRFPRIAEGVREASLVFLVFMFYDASRYFALDEEYAYLYIFLNDEPQHLLFFFFNAQNSSRIQV